ncbi:uncharacterized protein ACA1_113310, partial [Acanthamoeba castellanii str. Neff]
LLIWWVFLLAGRCSSASRSCSTWPSPSSPTCPPSPATSRAWPGPSRRSTRRGPSSRASSSGPNRTRRRPNESTLNLNALREQFALIIAKNKGPWLACLAIGV